MEGYERCCELARTIVKSGWMNSFNPMVQELITEAELSGVEICFDDCWIAVEDEVFYTVEAEKGETI